MIAEMYGINVIPEMRHSVDGLRMGCEFEIENILSSNAADTFVTVTQDGSLRNDGKEYISFPSTVVDTVEVFERLHSTVEYGPDAFSERTSIHVHANCCNLFPQEVRNIVLLYALFEESFFAMVAPSRRNNIHCVALTETHLPNYYRHNCANMITKWHKYTALNLKPLTVLGTMEFRHMHGHNDVTLFKEWVGLIEKLFVYGHKFKPTSHTLEDKALGVMFSNLFGETHLKDKWDEQRALMENQIIDVKMSTLSL